MKTCEDLLERRVRLWTWETIGIGSPDYAYNIIVERGVPCADAATRDSIFQRLWAVAMQIDRAGQMSAHGGAHAGQPPAPPPAVGAAQGQGRLMHV